MEDRDCPRCGSLLPDSEEGVCRTCQYAYGRATLHMPVLPRAPTQDQNTPAQVPEQAAGGNRRLWLALLLLLGLLGIALGALGWFFYQWDQANELPEPPALEGAAQDSPPSP